MTLNDRIKKIRIEKKIARQEIANKLDISLSAYTHYENGTRNPSIEVLIKIADIFETSLDFLIRGEYSTIINCNKDIIVKSIPIIDIDTPNIKQKNETFIPMILPSNEAEKYFCIKPTRLDMCNNRIPVNSTILFYKQDYLEEGTLFLALLDNKVYIMCNIQKEEKLTVLKPVNNKYKILVCTDTDIRNGKVKFIGKAISITYNIDTSFNRCKNIIEEEEEVSTKGEYNEDFQDERFKIILDT